MSQHRRQLTMLDVAVVIVLLSLVTAVLFPMILQARESSRRGVCKNRLKAIGLALHQYEELHKTFPPGWVAPMGDATGASGFGWGVMLLPHLANTETYRRFDMNADLASPVNMQNAELTLEAFRCPSDQGSALAMVLPDLAPIGTANYVGNFGVGIPRPDLRTTFNQGIFAQNSRVRIRDIRDGTTNVVLVAERVIPPKSEGWKRDEIEGQFASLWSGVPRPGVLSPLSTVFTVTTGDVTQIGENESLNIVAPLNGLTGKNGAMKVTLLRINRSQSNEPLDTFSQGTVVTAGISSRHPGGAHVILVDGSARFLDEKIEETIFVGVMRRNDSIHACEY